VRWNGKGMMFGRELEGNGGEIEFMGFGGGGG